MVLLSYIGTTAWTIDMWPQAPDPYFLAGFSHADNRSARVWPTCPIAQLLVGRVAMVSPGGNRSEAEALPLL